MTNPLKIYSGSNALLYTTPINTGCRRRVQLMNEDSITVKFSDSMKMRFPVGTRIGDFFITKEQQEKYNATTGGYDYELKFDAYYWLWANRLLFYVMPGVTNAPKETSFKLTATIDVHAAVILRCLNALGIKYDGSPFSVVTDEGFSAEVKYISYANMSVLGGIQAIAEAYECEWWIIGNAIHFGRCNDIREYDFTVGGNVASITSDSKETAPNRLIIFGSTRNLPPNYRTPESSDVADAVVVKRLMLPEGTPYLQTSPNIPEDEIVEKEITLDSVYPRTALTVSDVVTYDSAAEDGNKQTFYRLKYGTSFLFSKDYILPDEELHIVFESGDLNGMDFAVRFNPTGAGEKLDDGSWNPDAQMFEIVVNEDYGRALPDGVLHPGKGDKFSLYGWDATKMEALGLVSAAEQELLAEGNKLLEEYRKDKQTYTCPMMWDWCKEQAEEGNTPRLGSVVNLHFTAGDAGRKSRIIGFEHDLDIEYSNVTYICGEKVSVSRLKTLESKVEGLTYTGEKVKIQNSLDFLSKRYSDRTPYQLASDLGFEVGNYLAGVSGGMFGIDKADGQSFAEVAKLFVRGKAFFETLTTIEAQTLAGKQYITPGGAIKCSKVEEVKDTDGNVTAYRCYFLSEQDGEKTDTKIIAGDQAVSEMFNAKSGTSNKISNHRYWRYVNAVNNDAYTDDAGNHYGYIDLSASDCEAGSDIPQAGDIIDQLGNRTDATRQTAIIFSTVDADSPSIKMFGGIGSGETNAEHYTLNGKAIISFGRDATTGKVYFRLGATGSAQYLDYKQDSGLELAGKFSVGSTLGDKTFEKWLTDHGYTDDTLAQAAKDAADDAQTSANEAKSELDKYKYLKAALKDKTTIQNSLILSGLVSLGSNNEDFTSQTTWSGISGIYDETLGGRSIAAWYGGDMIDRYNALDVRLNEEGVRYAASLFRMDGSGYLADGMIRWKSREQGGGLILGDGITLDISGNPGLTSTLESIINFRLNFSRLIKPQINAVTDTDWDDLNANTVRITGDLVADGIVSASAGSPGSIAASALGDLTDVTLSGLQNGHALVYENGQWVNKAIGGGLDEAALGTYLTTNNYAKKSDIPSNYVTLDTTQTITGVKFFDGAVAHSTAVFFQKTGHEGGCYLSPQETGALDISTHVNRTWVATVASFQSDGIFRSFYGVMAPNFTVPGGTSTQFLKADGSLDSNGYLNKAGDTMSGALTLPYNCLVVNSNGGDTAIRVLKSYGAGFHNHHYLNFGHDPSDGNSGELDFYYAGAGSASNSISMGFFGAKYLTATYGGELTWANQTIWHSGNDGSGSGLDADLLDGRHGTDFAHMDVVHGQSGDSNLGLLQSAFSRFADSRGRAVRLERGSHSMAFGWFLQGYPYEQAYGGWFISDYGDPTWVGVDNGSWKSETFAFLSSNVASATKLQTGRSIWGQSFNGTGNVSGDMIGIAGGIAIHHYNEINCYNGNLYINYRSESTPDELGTTGHIYMCSNGGNVSIGSNDPTYRLTVAGDICATNGWLRTYGQCGLYFESYGGGFRMIDSMWIRTYGDKHFYTGSGIIRSDNRLEVGGDGSAFYANSAGIVRAAGEIISTSANAFRAIQGNYGFIIRNDGSATYFLLTAPGDQYGSWNHLRPFYISNISGDVTMEHNLEVRGNIMCKGVVAAAA